MNGPAQLDDERRSSDPDCREDERPSGTQPARSAAPAQGSTGRKQQLPGKGIEIPNMPLGIGGNGDVGELYDDIEQERCR